MSQCKMMGKSINFSHLLQVVSYVVREIHSRPSSREVHKARQKNIRFDRQVFKANNLNSIRIHINVLNHSSCNLVLLQTRKPLKSKTFSLKVRPKSTYCKAKDL